MTTGETGPRIDPAVLARSWLTDLLCAEAQDRSDCYLAPDCQVHVDGATIDRVGLRSLVEAYQAVFPTLGIDVDHVVTWQDKAMVAYTIRYAAAGVVPQPRRATAFLAVADERVTEVWMLDDWPGWLERQLRAG